MRLSGRERAASALLVYIYTSWRSFLSLFFSRGLSSLPLRSHIVILDECLDLLDQRHYPQTRAKPLGIANAKKKRRGGERKSARVRERAMPVSWCAHFTGNRSPTRLRIGKVYYNYRECGIERDSAGVTRTRSSPFLVCMHIMLLRTTWRGWFLLRFASRARVFMFESKLYMYIGMSWCMTLIRNLKMYYGNKL